MCVLVLIDAGIVVAEILLDLHAIRCKSYPLIDRSSLLTLPYLTFGVGGY